MKKLFIILFVLFCVAIAYAAVDIRDKRSGAISIHTNPMYPLADGAIDANDRGQIIGVYPIGSVGGGGPGPGAAGGRANSVFFQIRR